MITSQGNTLRLTSSVIPELTTLTTSTNQYKIVLANLSNLPNGRCLDYGYASYVPYWRLQLTCSYNLTMFCFHKSKDKTMILHVDHKVDSVVLIKERKGYVNHTLYAEQKADLSEGY